MEIVRFDVVGLKRKSNTMKKLITLLTLAFCFNCYSQQKWEYSQLVRHHKPDTRVIALLVGGKTMIAGFGRGEQKDNAYDTFRESWNKQMNGYIKIKAGSNMTDSALLCYLGVNEWELITVNTIQRQDGYEKEYYLKRPLKRRPQEEE